jgi:DNA helicase-2/ATP-dependent DNA helicase PcrA
LYGKYTYQRPSRFLAEIPEYLKDGAHPKGRRAVFSEVDDEDFSGPIASDRGRSLRNDGKSDKVNEIFVPGDKIIHKSWGPGSIVSSNGSGSAKTYTVAFPDKGIRVLQADIAPIKRME